MFQIFCDFDGTITRQDSLKLLFYHFIPSDWSSIEKKMYSGEISEPQALQLAIQKMPISLDSAVSWLLKRIELDPTFGEFLYWCRHRNLKFQILSGGIDVFIKALLEREGFFNVPFKANKAFSLEGTWHLSPATEVGRGCKSFSHCKCISMHDTEISALKSIYIGDGWTDRCPVQKADLVFAKSTLQNFCKEESVFFIPYESFSDIQFCLEEFFKNDVHIRVSKNEFLEMNSHLP